MSNDNKVVLVTGFGPFFNHKINASWEAVKEMATLGIEHEGQKVPLETREIPVIYKTISESIPVLWDEVKPVLCVHVGVSPYNCVKLEKFGRNIGYRSVDINIELPPHDNCCIPSGPDIIQTVFNVDEVSREVVEKIPNIQVQVSEDAGRYLCDFIYYTSLYHNRAPVVFVHVPPLDQPYSKSQLALSLKHIIETLLNHIKEGKITKNQ